ncbi:uncharacterized protein LOC100838123 isoform X2 [Brachypodium distachyon]|uniref:AB hydrolase-1 domain-containing protein n=2 Tax=Brachypodium distachyon TaxID=15368 RepID=I1IST0_BRADI|nr:uncharacterized protein LOC100838123 isoform X2 [Brachypodium distachyon]KQJ91462.1 hypothetical protein BRADI_4g37870v3 [Brachypodium distachyon]|eukprot:XP_003576834.1 uncharacterized protein LOC100838123 isoform X2 [Brachypodium distachyon]
MVNWVEVLRKHLLGRIAKNAGLRQHAVAVDAAAPGTVINLWLPDHKLKPPKQNQNDPAATNKRPAVVLVHGFAGDGMMTWAFQVGALRRQGYDVYVPDLVHFGGSTSPSPDRSVAFQARCIAAALGKLGVERCAAVVGFSYGGLVAFQMAAACPPGMVRSVVVSGSSLVFTGAMSDALLGRLGGGGAGTGTSSSLTELMLPDSVGGLRFLFAAATHMKLWFPRRVLSDFLKVMYNNRKERAELLENMITCRDEKAPAPVFQQNILLLWGEDDDFFPVEGAKMLKEELGEKATLRSISRAGHLAHLERPCVYNRCLKEFLALAMHSPTSSWPEL